MSHGYKRVMPSCVREALAGKPTANAPGSRGLAAPVADDRVPAPMPGPLAGTVRGSIRRSDTGGSNEALEGEMTCYSCAYSEGFNGDLMCGELGIQAIKNAEDCGIFLREPGTDEGE